MLKQIRIKIVNDSVRSPSRLEQLQQALRAFRGLSGMFLNTNDPHIIQNYRRMAEEEREARSHEKSA